MFTWMHGVGLLSIRTLCVRANVGELTFEEAYNMAMVSWAKHPSHQGKIPISFRAIGGVGQVASSKVVMKPVRL